MNYKPVLARGQDATMAATTERQPTLQQTAGSGQATRRCQERRRKLREGKEEGEWGPAWSARLRSRSSRPSKLSIPKNRLRAGHLIRGAGGASPLTSALDPLLSLPIRSLLRA